jgi:hypothetical protein
MPAGGITGCVRHLAPVPQLCEHTDQLPHLPCTHGIVGIWSLNACGRPGEKMAVLFTFLNVHCFP